MKIGYIPGALDTLSGEYLPHFVHMRESIAALKKKADISVLRAEGMSSKYPKVQKAGFYGVIDRKCMHIIRKVLHCVFFFGVFLELRRKINQEQYDLFLVRYSLSNFFICRYLHSRGHKIILEAHGLAHVEERECGQTCVPPFYFIVLAFLEKKMLSWADQITVVSEALKDSLARHGVDKWKVHVIPNAVDTQKFDCVTSPSDIVKKHELEDKIVIGFVGSFASYHGFELLLDIAENLHNKYENIRLLLVGRNFDGSGSPMQMAVARGLAHLCAYAGEVPHSRVPSYIAIMDIALIPDFNEYGSPMKLFEYMAMRKAVVAADVPPIREVIEHGRTGILFEKGNSAEAVKCIEQLIEDEKFRHEMGQRAYVEVTTSYTWDQNADKIIGIAEGMLR